MKITMEYFEFYGEMVEMRYKKAMPKHGRYLCTDFDMDIDYYTEEDKNGYEQPYIVAVVNK